MSRLETNRTPAPNVAPTSHSGKIAGAVLHAGVAILFLGLAIAWSWPLGRHLATTLPGGGIGDNAMFLWNFWWMRAARTLHTNFFHTTYLFAPIGADLTLNTHTALPAFVGATLLKPLPVIAALNVTIIAGIALSAFCAYLLSWTITGDRAASVVAGIVFGSSPYIAAHLNGHFNLTMAWPVPLFAMGTLAALRGSRRGAVAAGSVLGATAFIDYYYVVFELAFVLCAVAILQFEWSVRRRPAHRGPGWVVPAVALVGVLDLAAIVLILATGGVRLQIGPVPLILDRLFNPLQILWILVLAASWLYFRPEFRVRLRTKASVSLTVQQVGIMLAVFVAAAAPLLLRGFRLITAGGYVTQRAGWRSAPAGIDIASLLLGNPFQAAWGAWVRSAYAKWHIDVIESGAWLGLAPVALAVYAIRRQWRESSATRFWATVGLIAFVWALGAHVHAFGVNTGMIMPEALLRFTPIVSNARMPGRAMVIVYLALAVLCAVAIAELRLESRHPALVFALTAVVVAVDFWPAPFPIVTVDCPSIYDTLRQQSRSGAVAVLPIGLRDGFGELAPFDHRVLACQPIFNRPIVGGAVARLPPSVLAGYRSDPLIAWWLRESGARSGVVTNPPAPDRQLAGRQLAADGIGYIVLNRATASATLRAYVDHVMPVTRIADESEYTLYEVR